MLKLSQVLVLMGLGIGLWLLATLSIRLFPASMTDPLLAAVTFVTTFPIGWLSVWLVRYVGRLAKEQLVRGVAVVGACAMMIDGAVLHWAPSVYGTDDTVVRFGAAWLLWGYGVSFAIALLCSPGAARLKT